MESNIEHELSTHQQRVQALKEVQKRTDRAGWVSGTVALGTIALWLNLLPRVLDIDVLRTIWGQAVVLGGSLIIGLFIQFSISQAGESNRLQEIIGKLGKWEEGVRRLDKALLDLEDAAEATERIEPAPGQGVVDKLRGKQYDAQRLHDELKTGGAQGVETDSMYWYYASVKELRTKEAAVLEDMNLRLDSLRVRIDSTQAKVLSQ